MDPTDPLSRRLHQLQVAVQELRDLLKASNALLDGRIKDLEHTVKTYPDPTQHHVHYHYGFTKEQKDHPCP